MNEDMALRLVGLLAVLVLIAPAVLRLRAGRFVRLAGIWLAILLALLLAYALWNTAPP